MEEGEKTYCWRKNGDGRREDNHGRDAETTALVLSSGGQSSIPKHGETIPKREAKEKAEDLVRCSSRRHSAPSSLKRFRDELARRQGSLARSGLPKIVFVPRQRRPPSHRNKEEGSDNDSSSARKLITDQRQQPRPISESGKVKEHFSSPEKDSKTKVHTATVPLFCPSRSEISSPSDAPFSMDYSPMIAGDAFQPALSTCIGAST